MSRKGIATRLATKCHCFFLWTTLGMGFKITGLLSIHERIVTLKASEIASSDRRANTTRALEILRASIADGLGFRPERIDLSFSFSIKPAVTNSRTQE